jgi:hypothetical protein
LPDWEPPSLEAFLEAIADTKQSVLILDPFFDLRGGLLAIWDFLAYSKATEIKILTPRQECNDGIREWLKEKESSLPIDIRKTTLDFHDRFAALDGELWHFGSTVGGAYPMFSAATRGWPAADFRTVFASLWRDAT